MTNSTPSQQVKTHLEGGRVGILSTILTNERAVGFPFGSVTPYALNEEGWPMLVLAGIAQHTRNLKADGRASLIVCEEGRGGDAQAGWRVTVLGRAWRLLAAAPAAGAAPTDRVVGAAALAAAKARYVKRVPTAAGYFGDGSHGFGLWVIEPVTYRYIAGFGGIHWVEAGER